MTVCLGNMSRRHILAAVLAALAFVRTAWAQQPYTGQTLPFATFGRAWQKWVEQTIEPPFTALTGAKVEYVPGNPQQFGRS